MSEGKKEILYDEAFAPLLSKYTWVPVKIKNNYYAKANVYFNEKVSSILMHRIVMGMPNMMIDHINGNGLDNRLSNLRLATPSNNATNRKYKNKFGYRGVFQSQGLKGFQAKIKDNKKLIYIGTFDTVIEAAKAYDKEAKRLHGEFAVLNFPEAV